jgi:nucleotide-binding universal stress UspA family protein
MFKKVVVGVDGGPGGRDAVALAKSLAGRDGKLTLAFVDARTMAPSHLTAAGRSADDREHERGMLAETASEADLEAELTVLSASSPGRGLHQQAEAEGADLLVVGSCRRGVLGRAMLGNDTRAALNGASCAVAIAARGFAEGGRRIERIGVGYDGSAESAAALTAARRLAAATGANIRAMRVVWMSAYGYDAPLSASSGEAVEGALDEARAELKEMPEIEGRVSYGLAGGELAAFGDELDLLLVGSRNYGPLSRLMLGSTSDYLVRHARCSLLVLPRGALATRGIVGEQTGEGAQAAAAR